MSGEFKIEDGTSVAEAVGTALGYASMCWVGDTGDLEFDSERARQCAQELTDAIINGRLRVDGTGLVPKPSRWQPLDSPSGTGPGSEIGEMMTRGSIGAAGFIPREVDGG